MRRGEIYTVDLGPGQGREADGSRPVVVVTNDFFNSMSWLVTVVPGMDASQGMGAWPEILVTAAESGLPGDLRFQPLEIRSLDSGRFPAQPVGVVPAARMIEIEAALRVILEIK